MRNFLKYLWWILINAGFLLCILLLGLFLFTATDQSRDFVYVLIQGDGKGYKTMVVIALCMWSYVLWYSTSITLKLSPLQKITQAQSQLYPNNTSSKNRDIYHHLIHWMPKIIGILPFVLILIAVNSTKFPKEENLLIYTNIGIIILLIMMYGMLTYLEHRYLKKDDDLTKLNLQTKPLKIKREGQRLRENIIEILRSRPYKIWPKKQELIDYYTDNKFKPSIGEDLRFIFIYRDVKKYFVWGTIYSIVAMLVLGFPLSGIPISLFLRPATVLILALIFITIVTTIIYYFHDFQRRPFIIIVIIFITIFSYFNDNTEAELKQSPIIEKRMEFKEQFHAWVNNKFEKWNSSDSHRGKPMPVFFIAAQGGGSRGVYFTTEVLNSLNSKYPEFIDQTYIISGVSGGGVGSCMYLAYLSEFGNRTAGNWGKFREITSGDYLSPVTASYAFGETFQKFMPFPISALERSKVVGRTWERLFNQMSSKVFEQQFHSIWYPEKQKDRFQYQIPSLILNGTLAENGQRVLTSNLSFRGDSFFNDDLEYFKIVKSDIKVSSAALNCCRFPFLMSGCLIRKPDGYRVGHIIDGGYRENTGLQTIMNVLSSLKNTIVDFEKKGVNIQPVVIYIKNGKDELSTAPSAIRVCEDYLTPLTGIVNVNGTSVPSKGIEQTMKEFLLDSGALSGAKYHRIWLEERDNDRIVLPLAWFMSDTAITEIDKRVSRMNYFDSSLYKLFNHIGLNVSER